jgi:arabinofuranosyltransferase
MNPMIVSRPGIARVAQLGILVVLTGMAWSQRWVQDDAYITFRYAKNVVLGLGPVWNPGYAVEGYTNFTWMALIALGMRLGFAPEPVSYVLGLWCFVISLLLVFRLARDIMFSDAWALFAMCLAGTNYSFLMYATGGLETQLNAMLTLALLVLAVEALCSSRLALPRTWMASVAASLAIMTRPDSVLIATLVVVVLARVAWSDRNGRRWRLLAVLFLPAAILVGSWIAWKVVFYGRLLPNTFYAKLENRQAGTLMRGAVYVAWLFVSYWWLPVIGGLIAFARIRGTPSRKLISMSAPERLLIVYAVVWLSYVVWTGGDIMEFRQLVPVIPVVIVLMTGLLARALADVRQALPVAGLFLVASVVHATWFPTYMYPMSLGTIPTLRLLGGQGEQANWAAMGRRLAVSLGADSRVSIAVAPAGALPFFSGLRTVDMHGLNDKWIAQHGHVMHVCQVCTAHARFATLRYLNQQGVNLLIGQPQRLHFSTPAANPEQVVRIMLKGEPLDYEHFPKDATLLRIPLHDDVAFAAAYFKRDASIDRLLKEGSWRSQPIGPVTSSRTASK